MEKEADLGNLLRYKERTVNRLNVGCQGKKEIKGSSRNWLKNLED